MIASWSVGMLEAITTDGPYEAYLSTGATVTFKRIDLPANKTAPTYIDLLDYRMAIGERSYAPPVPSRLSVRTTAVLTLHRI